MANSRAKESGKTDADKISEFRAEESIIEKGDFFRYGVITKLLLRADAFQFTRREV